LTSIERKAKNIVLLRDRLYVSWRPAKAATSKRLRSEKTERNF